MLAPALCTLGVADGWSRPGQGGEQLEGAQQQPAEPYAFALAAFADAVHAVVPVATADQWQAEFAGQLQALLEAPGAVLEQRGFFGGDHRLEEGIVLLGLQQRPVEERYLFLQQ